FGLRQLHVGLGARDRGAVLPVVDLDQRVALLHVVAFLDQVAIDAAADAHADRDVAVGADDVPGAREDRDALACVVVRGDRDRGGLDHRHASGGNVTTGESRCHEQYHGGGEPARPATWAPGCALAVEAEGAEMLAEVWGSGGHQACRGASTTGRWAARQAGPRPPNTPIAVAKPTPRSAPPTVGSRSTVATVKVIMLKATPESNVLM